MTARLRWMVHAAAALAILVTTLVHAQPRATIAVVFSRDAAPYRQALRGFEEVLERSGRAYRLHPFYLDSLPLGEKKLIERIRAKNPDLVLTLGSTATSVVSQSIEDIPIVFSLVLPSAGAAALHGSEGRRRNMTGSSMEIPIQAQFREVLAILPGARRIGVLYDPKVTGNVVASAAEVAARMGVELVPMRVSSERDLVEQADTMLKGVDVLWSVADSTVFSPQGLRQVLLSTLRNRIPFVGLSPSFVTAGALMAFSVDYKDVGRQSAEAAVRILAGEDPASIRMTSPRAVSLSLNMNTAKQIDVPIDDEIRRRAQLFF